MGGEQPNGRSFIKENTLHHFLGLDLKVDNSALEANRDSVSSIAGIQLGKDVRDTALDRRLSDEE